MGKITKQPQNIANEEELGGMINNLEDDVQNKVKY